MRETSKISVNISKTVHVYLEVVTFLTRTHHEDHTEHGREGEYAPLFMYGPGLSAGRGNSLRTPQWRASLVSSQ